ncbi:aspartate/glutamate racemase family protein [Castellaniella defragrans]|uniref:aspartate/glutamate racemase family protein n=1 Tax=Castellaniella defragrans TaxID=75697 RepID=UPI002AFF5429|nr:aspartate/glutamate racemase family protein [Castellaniella defragrans]
MKLLLINPNTSPFVTDMVAAAARTVIAPDVELTAVTGTYGPPIVSGRSEDALAAVEAMRLALEHAPGHDAVVLAISFDSGLQALRERLDIPVVGMTEAAMLTAMAVADRFALITFGYHARGIYVELARRYGLDARMSTVLSLPQLSDEQIRDPARVFPALRNLIEEVVRKDQAEAIILSGAIFANICGDIAPLVSVPVLNGVREAVGIAQSLVRLNLKKPLSGSYRLPEPKPVKWPFDVIERAYQSPS